MVLVFDFTGYSLSHLANVNMAMTKKLMPVWEVNIFISLVSCLPEWLQHDDPLPNGYSVVINGHYNTTIYNLQDASPLRPKSLNYVNTPSIFTTLNNLFSPLMKEKMRQRVRILLHI